MKRKRKRQHFVVQHDLASLRALPQFIWNTARHPEPFDRVRNGDRWIAYAHIKDESERKRCRFIVGFYECIEPCQRRFVPLDEARLVKLGCKKEQRAWMIEGKEFGKQLPKAVALPREEHERHPIESFLGRRIFRNQTLIPIEPDEFERILAYALGKAEQ